MRIYKIVVYGDNDRLHEDALKAACAAVEDVTKGSAVYRAWIDGHLLPAPSRRRPSSSGSLSPFDLPEEPIDA